MDRDLLSIADARDCARRSAVAFESYRRFDQEAVDRITGAVAEAASAAAESLARLAVEETGMGTVAGKTAKNRFSSLNIWEGIRDMRTCGIVREDREQGLWEVADPFGVVAAIIPTTNPTSTAMFKALICLKSRNAMVASPHPRSAGCIKETIRVCHDAAVAAGAPRDVLTCMSHVHLEGTQALMQSDDVSLILATGGSALVRAAYSSGKPAFGVGPGNVPAYVDRSADPDHVARCLVDSQTLDNGTICSSEQAVICDRPVADPLKQALLARGAWWCTRDEVDRLARVAIRQGVTNPDLVGLSAARVARAAGFKVPEETSVLIAPSTREEVGPEHPLSLEKLCPLLTFFEVDGWEEGCQLCLEILDLGGRGHTLGLHCKDDAIIRAFAIEKPVNRLVVNSPTSQGAVGLTTNLFPSMTLGCGSFGGNITSDNIGPQHLLNIKRVAWATRAYMAEQEEHALAATPEEPAHGSVPASSWQPRPAGAGSPAARPSAPEVPPAAIRRNPGAVFRRVQGGGGSGPLVMGNPGRPLPGEHFWDEELAHIVQDAIAKRARGR